MVPGKIGIRKIGPRKTQKQKIVGWASSIVVCVCVCVCGMLECNQFMKTQTNPNKPSWTPLVFYSLVHVKIDKNKKVVQISWHSFDGEQFLKDTFPETNFPGIIFPGDHFSGDFFPGNHFSEDHFSAYLHRQDCLNPRTRLSIFLPSNAGIQSFTHPSR